MKEELLNKYNIPVPRYTSYPPANYFDKSFTSRDYKEAVVSSNHTLPGTISFYIHIPFCQHLCHYCGCNSFHMMKQEVVNRYIAAVHKEIDMVCKLLSPERKIAQIHYGGGSPTAMPINVIKELNEHMLSGFSTIQNPEIAIECHPGYLTEENWLDLSKAGFTRFSIGVQDFDEKVLKTVNRRPSLLPMETILKILHSSGARVNMDFIYGLPYQSAKSFSHTIERASELRPDRLVTFSYAHVPWVNKSQLILEKAGLPDSEEKTNMYKCAVNIMHSNGYKSIGLDHFVLPEDELYTALCNNQLHRNFQGYCTRRTTGQVYAFGVTGISQLSTAYAQNSKDIHQYIEMIEQGEFTISKGYSLNNDEQITREVIETLMCNYRIDWYELSERLSMSIEEIKAHTAYNDEKIKEFAEDGLLRIEGNTLQMTEEGALFVRNVAASMDKLMINSSKSYSKPV